MCCCIGRGNSRSLLYICTFFPSFFLSFVECSSFDACTVHSIHDNWLFTIALSKKCLRGKAAIFLKTGKVKHVKKPVKILFRKLRYKGPPPATHLLRMRVLPQSARVLGGRGCSETHKHEAADGAACLRLSRVSGSSGCSRPRAEIR